ncbi:hypothetical protein LEP1GSC195_1428 [Leptospira wolbachii serovar Codice str. CDC]|uniref:Uncharacterized protein n=1 Tax=Leptospira wolbachii serovar Codice str. CDC TaxID=1218599 RepID=R8ZYH3_9LEPT|nr:hypothetical protein LEP1GSC195_1428 [Leptospira wolbachii serovar Codice str. CDC]
MSLQEKEQISNAGTISSIVGLLISIIILQATENIFNARRRALIEKDFEKKRKEFYTQYRNIFLALNTQIEENPEVHTNFRHLYSLIKEHNHIFSIYSKIKLVIIYWTVPQSFIPLSVRLNILSWLGAILKYGDQNDQ